MEFEYIPTFKRGLQLAASMAFRDHLEGSVRALNTDPQNGMREFIEQNLNSVVMFEEIEGHEGHRAAANVCLRQKMMDAFGINPTEFLTVIADAVENRCPPRIITEEAPVMAEKMEPVNLNALPIPHHYPQDRGHYMSASIVIAQWGEQRNVSFHRQFIRDDNHIVARLVPRHLRTIVDEARAEGKEVNIAIVNGADPVVLLAAAMSFDEPIDEMTVAAYLHQKFYGRPLEVVTLSNGIEVPADAEYAMVAKITLDDDDEGPYIDITGTVDEIRQEPVIEVLSIHHRTDPILHVLLPGRGEHHALMGLPRAPTILTAVSQVCECRDVVMTSGGSGWLSAVVQIRVRKEGDAQAAIMAAFAGHPSMKSVTIVDEDIDPADPVRVEWAMMTRWQPDSDTIILSDQKGSSLDPTRDENGRTSKIGYDATIPWGRDRSEFVSHL